MALDLSCIPSKSVEEWRDCILADYQHSVLGGRRVPDGDFMHLAAYIWAGAAYQFQADYHLKIRAAIDIESACCEEVFSKGSAVGLPRRPARAARGYVTITGTSGATIPASIGFVSSTATGSQTYSLGTLVTNPVVIGADGSAVLFVQADIPGTGANLLAPQNFSLTSAVADIDATARVAALGIAGGADEETCEEMRARLVEHRRNACVAGNLAWYTRAVLSFPGVSRVCWTGCECNNCCSWPMTGYVWMDDVYPSTDGEPPTSVLLDIEDYVWGRPRGRGNGLAQVGDVGQLFTPKKCRTTVVVHNLQTINPQVQEAIAEAFRDFFRSRACVGETICGSELFNVLISVLPANCFRDIELRGDCVETVNDGRDFRFECGTYPFLAGITFRAR